MSAYAIVGAAIVAGSADVLQDHAVIVSQGNIESVIPASAVPSSMVIHRLPGGHLAPGLIDIHVHGALNECFTSTDESRLRTAAQFHLSRGVTTIVPTLVSGTTAEIAASLSSLAALKGQDSISHIPGVHLEGPHFSANQAGAQKIDILRAPNEVDTGVLLEHKDNIKIVSLAPELPGAVGLTKELTAANIVVAAGHSDATEAELRACQDAGLSHVIHLFSSQSTIRRKGPWRVPGLLEAALASDGLTVEIIADDRHLPRSLMKIADRCLRGQLCAVSDGTPGIGLPINTRYQMGAGQYVVGDGVGMTLDGTSFGGSTTVLSDMLPILNATLDIPLPDLVAMFTSIPARAAQLTGVGRILPGYQADFVHLDSALKVRATAKLGRWLTS